jgi:hypothetical protein
MRPNTDKIPFKENSISWPKGGRLLLHPEQRYRTDTNVGMPMPDRALQLTNGRIADAGITISRGSGIPAFTSSNHLSAEPLAKYSQPSLNVQPTIPRSLPVISELHATSSQHLSS